MSQRRADSRRARDPGSRIATPSSLARTGAGARREASRRRALLTWFRRSARRLPWRTKRDPYRTWVSEVMLQQTRVATVVPYFERFVARFPHVRALADAPLDEVLEQWSGLGYYRRARALHAAARLVVREHGARLPADADAFAALPGVGRYTLGAVLSLGFGARLAVLDGNVARVLARWTARPLQVKRPADARALWALAESLLPRARGAAGEWNEALMELGATVCTPRAPRCEACPVARACAARALGKPEAFPPGTAHRATERVRRAVAWIERGGRVLFARRSGRLLEGLWEPPGADVPAGAEAGSSLTAALRALGVRAALRDPGERVRHTITHRAIEVAIWRGSASAPVPRREDVRWIDPARPGVALTALARRLARQHTPRSEPARSHADGDDTPPVRRMRQRRID